MFNARRNVTRILAAGGFACTLFSLSGSASASSTASAGQTVTANINSAASLSLSSGTVTFTSATGTGTTAAAENGITISANARTTTSGSVTLTVLAGGDLLSGGNTIPISNVTWTSASTGFNSSGTLNKTTAQSVGSWTGSGNYSGTVSFFLANSWSYPEGSYAANITYTLTSP